MKATEIPAAVLLVLALGLALGGCATPTGAPAGAPSETNVTAAPAPSATPTPADPAAYDLPWLGADEGVAFNSPDGNIACGISQSKEFGDSYGCAIATHTYIDPPPAGTEVPCQAGFRRFKDFAPTVLCSGEPVSFAGQEGGASGVKVLALDTSISFNGVTCTSASVGITCLSADGRGFRIASDSYEVF